MTKARITLTLDEESKILVIRHIGDMDGQDIKANLLAELVKLDSPWTYDTLIDLRRYDGFILTSEVEDLSNSLAQLMQGRDTGNVSAIVSDDPWVQARISIMQSLAPHIVMKMFSNFDEALDWIKAQRNTQPDACALEGSA